MSVKSSSTIADETPNPGLSAAEVAQRVSQGLSNVNADVKTLSIPQIFAKHALTLFNVVNLFLAFLVLTTYEFRNILFMVIVALNLGIGVFQEIRAKLLVDKLSILTTKLVRVRREGRVLEVGIQDIVRDDLVLLSRGDQVPADGVVVEGYASMDESLLTGESNPIEKKPGSTILSGSFVDSGSIVLRLTKVGLSSYAARINSEAKYLKPVRSEILDTVRMIIRFSTCILIPLGICLFVRIYFFSGRSYDDAILQSVAATVGMIPQGLVLLTSTIFAIATTKLARKQVLVQQSYCVETLARTDVVCLDKTGTITTGSMELAHMCDASGNDSNSACADLIQALATIVYAGKDSSNETARALMHAISQQNVKPAEISRVIAFSSRTKFSGCVTAAGEALVMGAAQFVLRDEYPKYQHVLNTFAPTHRVLVVGRAPGFDKQGALMGTGADIVVFGFVTIREEIRPSAAETIAYFAREGVDVRVISGDDPKTVSHIAGEVGVAGAQDYVDCTSLSRDEDFLSAAAKYHIFGRVTPAAKRKLVRALQTLGHCVTMTGDGVNDVLALKEADCSVAMSSGSAAARNVSELVLADNDFSHLPDVVSEGRRSINNLQRSAALFLTKTVYSALLALVCLLIPPYPFIPIQMSLINVAAIGVPSFLLALEVNHERVRGSFVVNVFERSLPASAAIVGELMVTMILCRVFEIPQETMSTLCMIEMALVGIALIYKISLPLNKLRSAVLVLCIALVFVGCTCLHDFLRIGVLGMSELGLCAALSACGLVLFHVLYKATVEHKALDGFFSLVKRATSTRTFDTLKRASK